VAVVACGVPPGSMTKMPTPDAGVLAVRNRRLPTILNCRGLPFVPAPPTLKSRTSVVPAGVPSVRHSSLPTTPSFAAKYT
jgi:hypothetical protein